MSDRLKHRQAEVHPQPRPRMIERYICCTLFAGLLVLVLLMSVTFPSPHLEYDLPALLL